MPTSTEEILTIAKLVRLDLTAGPDADRELSKIASQIDDILAYMNTMEHIDTNEVEPMYSPLREWASPRPDVASEGRNAEAVLSNAPERHDTFFVVPPVL